MTSPKEVNRYDNEERIRKDENKKVGNIAVLAFNIHTFGSALGLGGDDVYYLEKLYLRIRGILEIYTEKLIAGYEVNTALLYMNIYNASLLNACMLNFSLQNTGDILLS